MNEKMHRIVMHISYMGDSYNGWQRQSHSKNTIQEHIENAISHVANEKVKTHCAGRTDSGVHGTGQIIHFDTLAIRSPYSWKMGVNSNLPQNIRTHWAQPVKETFHARFSAINRKYQYVIEDNSIGNAILRGLVTCVRQELNVDKMHSGAQFLLGENDFSTFRAAKCQSRTPFRNIESIDVYRQKHFIVIEIQANAFLYHMVRNIVGALILVGQEKKPPEWVGEILAQKNRCKASITAPSDGLYLVEVAYDKEYRLPQLKIQSPLL